MTRRGWTAEDCHRQLGHTGLKLSLGPDDRLILDAPLHIEITPDMIRVVRKFKPGLLKILREIQQNEPQKKPEDS